MTDYGNDDQDIDDNQPFCPESYIFTVSIRNTPKMDDQSDSDVYFKMYNAHGQKVHTSATQRNLAKVEEFTYEATNPVEVDVDGDWKIKFSDADKGFMNTDDKMTSWTFDINDDADGEWHDVYDAVSSKHEHDNMAPFEVKIEKKTELQFLRTLLNMVQKILMMNGDWEFLSN